MFTNQFSINTSRLGCASVLRWAVSVPATLGKYALTTLRHVAVVTFMVWYNIGIYYLHII